MMKMKNRKKKWITWTGLWLLASLFLLSPVYAYDIEHNGTVYQVSMTDSKISILKGGQDVTYSIEPADYATLKASYVNLEKLMETDYSAMADALDTKREIAYRSIKKHETNLAETFGQQVGASLATSLATHEPISILDTVAAAAVSQKGIYLESDVLSASYGIVNSSHYQLDAGIKEIESIMAQPAVSTEDIIEISKLNRDILSSYKVVSACWDNLHETWEDSADPSATVNALIGVTTSLTYTNTAYSLITVGGNILRSAVGMKSLSETALINQIMASVEELTRPGDEFSAVTKALYTLEALAGRQQLAEAEKTAVEEEINTLSEQLVTAKNVEFEKHNSVESLISEIETLKQEHQVFEDKYDAAKKDFDAAEALYLEAKAKMDDIADELDDLQGDIALYERALDNYERGIITLTPQQVANYQATLAQLIEDEDDLQKSLRGQEGLMKEEQEAKNLYESLLAQAEQQVTNSANEIQTKTDQKTADEQVLAQVQQEIPVIETGISDNQQTLADLEPAIAELQTKVVEQQSEVETLKNQPEPEVVPPIDYSNLGEYAMQMVTGSPVEISQSVDILDSPMQLTFDYLFTDSTGWLEVLLGDTQLMEIDGTSIVTDTFHTGEFWFDSEFFGLNDQKLTFLFNDNKSGSELFLDNINMLGIVNGDFSQGMVGWNIAGEGSADIVDEGNVLQIDSSAPVPEPATFLLFGVGVLIASALGRKQRIALE